MGYVPNTAHAIDDPATLALIQDQAEREAMVNVYLTGTLTLNIAGEELAPIGSLKEAGVVAIFGRRMIMEEGVTIFGGGGQTRDFVFVDDVAEPFVAAADRGDGRLFNIGTGGETPVNRSYRSMAEVLDLPLIYI